MTTTETTVREAVLQRDRIAVVAALLPVIALSWIWILLGAGTGMTAIAMTLGSGMPGGATMLMERSAWSQGYAGLICRAASTCCGASFG